MAAQRAAGLIAQLGEVAGTEVGQFVVFPVTPEVFDGIELGRVGRQLLDREAAVLRGDELFDHPPAMSGQPVPHHQKLAPQVAQQMAQEVGDFRAPNSAAIEPEVEVPPGDPGRSRQHLPAEVILQDRSLSARSPSPHPMWAFAQSTLVDEDDGSPLPERFFLSCGRRYFFQYRIARSSRSSARPAGRWQLQLSLRRMRQTWSSWYRTPVRYSMRSRTRLAVQSPLVKPNASGPRLSAEVVAASSKPKRYKNASPVVPSPLSALPDDLPDTAIMH